MLNIFEVDIILNYNFMEKTINKKSHKRVRDLIVCISYQLYTDSIRFNINWKIDDELVNIFFNRFSSEKEIKNNIYFSLMHNK